MNSNRLEAFSDGVLAIIITIMVLELHPPVESHDLADLEQVALPLVSYVLSFIYLGIYWNNHHHMLHAVRHVTGGALWANLHLLFWLSLLPFATSWMGETDFASGPTALYGFILFMAAAAYFILERVLIVTHGGKDSLLAKAVGRDLKGKASPVLYAIAIGFALFAHELAWISGVLYAAVALMWLIPDRRIERQLAAEQAEQDAPRDRP